MKLRSATLALFALALFALPASAQASTIRIRTPKTAEMQFGSVARTKLLQQVRGSSVSKDVLNLGSVARRAILTGKRVQLPPRKPEIRTRRR